jgi:hypothetical protein
VEAPTACDDDPEGNLHEIENTSGWWAVEGEMHIARLADGSAGLAASWSRRAVVILTTPSAIDGSNVSSPITGGISPSGVMTGTRV